MALPQRSIEKLDQSPVRGRLAREEINANVCDCKLRAKRSGRRRKLYVVLRITPGTVESRCCSMIEDTIAKIEEKLRTAQNLPSSERAELEGLLAQLRTEASSLPDLMERSGEAGDEDVQSALGRLEE